MTPQHKPGALALVTGAKRNTENIGREVELVRTVAPGEPIPETGTVAAFTLPDDRTTWLVTAEGLLGTNRHYLTGVLIRVRSDFAIMHRSHLLPIGDKDQHTTTTYHKELERAR